MLARLGIGIRYADYPCFLGYGQSAEITAVEYPWPGYSPPDGCDTGRPAYRTPRRIIDEPTQVDETQQVCLGFKGQDPPRDRLSRGGSPEGGRTRWSGEQGDEMTLVAACRDVLQVASMEHDHQDCPPRRGIRLDRRCAYESSRMPLVSPATVLAKFRGLSKQGLEQAARTFGFLRSLNLVRAPLHASSIASLSIRFTALQRSVSICIR
jgi:hypothetical protein